MHETMPFYRNGTAQWHVRKKDGFYPPDATDAPI